jgi:hypothetical protein
LNTIGKQIKLRGNSLSAIAILPNTLFAIANVIIPLMPLGCNLLRLHVIDSGIKEIRTCSAVFLPFYATGDSMKGKEIASEWNRSE